MLDVERPLLILPAGTDTDRATKSGGPGSINKPSLGRQQARLNPQFKQLKQAFDNRKIEFANHPDGIEPELALVMVTIGSSANFLSAVKKIEGLEWLAEGGMEGISPDDDFYDEENRDKELSGKFYCIMSNQRALDEMTSIWARYQENPDMEFPKGFASFKDLFASLKELRTWSAEDRFLDTGVLEQWKEDLEVIKGGLIPFEIELFYRSDPTAQSDAEQHVRSIVELMGGKVTSKCIINEIAYHGLAAQLPPERIEELISSDWNEIELAKTNQIMFFRPIAQMFDIDNHQHQGFIGDDVTPETPISSEPVVALFDGLPVENHQLLKNRLIIDDPDDYTSSYPVQDRIHGTEMASLIEHGDLNDSASTPVSRALYVRPILKPSFMKESFPEGELIVDVINRAIIRMKDGEGHDNPAAPSVKIVNLSIGDSQRQYLNSISPLARLLDWLSWKYQLLFIISSGNNMNPVVIQNDNATFKNSTIEERTHMLVDEVKRNNRNLRLFSPSESINALTIGSLFADSFSNDDTLRGVYPVIDNIPHPISAVGPGISRMIKPEILVPGGRLRVDGLLDDGTIYWNQFLNNGPGCRVAYPRSSQPTRGEGYAVGTSVSAALTSHAAHHLYDSLESVFLDNGEEDNLEQYAALLIKAMLVHGADWSVLDDAMSEYYKVDKQHAARWFGYGVPNFEKVQSCTKNRVTTIGFGELKNGHAHEFYLPIPLNLSTRSLRRKLTVTLAYFSPIASKRQEYRKAQIWFTREHGTERLTPLRRNTDWMGVRRGTLQHEIFIGDAPIPWGDDDELCIKVNCKQGSLTGAIGSAVPYAIFMTIEIADPVANIYDPIAERVRGRVAIHNQE